VYTQWSWGYRRNMELADVLSVLDVITQLASTISCGGNLLVRHTRTRYTQVTSQPPLPAHVVARCVLPALTQINVGPTSAGTIDAVFQDRLLGLGAWLLVNGEAVYSSKPWRAQNDTAAELVWYTSQPSTGAVYAIVLAWPTNNQLVLTQPVTTGATAVSMLGTPATVAFTSNGGSGMTVTLPSLAPSALPSTVAWVLKLTGVN